MYRTWATQLDAAVERLDEPCPAVIDALGARPVVGGVVERTVERGVEACLDHVALARTTIDEMAAECRRRAVVCDDYTAAVLAYEHRLADYEAELASWEPADGPPDLTPPRRPIPPAPWADVASTPVLGGPR